MCIAYWPRDELKGINKTHNLCFLRLARQYTTSTGSSQPTPSKILKTTRGRAAAHWVPNAQRSAHRLPSLSLRLCTSKFDAMRLFRLAASPSFQPLCLKMPHKRHAPSAPALISRSSSSHTIFSMPYVRPSCIPGAACSIVCGSWALRHARHGRVSKWPHAGFAAKGGEGAGGVGVVRVRGVGGGR